jgi:hypothetical protein
MFFIEMARWPRKLLYIRIRWRLDIEIYRWFDLGSNEKVSMSTSRGA